MFSEFLWNYNYKITLNKNKKKFISASTNDLSLL